MIYQRFSNRQLLAMLWWQQPKFKKRDALICDGSIRSGKSLCMAVGFILWSMAEFNGQNFAFCGKTIQSLRRNVILNLRNWVPDDFEIVEHRTENKLVVSDKTGRGNTYYLFGGRDESSYMLIQGITLAGVLLDEVALQPKSFVEQAIGRCSIEGSKFWFNCNPAGPSHWFYKEWIEGDKPKGKNALHVHFTMDDNPSLPPKIKARYEGMFSGVFYDRYIKGLWVVAEGLVYPMFNESMIVDELPWEALTRGKWYISLDYGTVNPTAAGLWCLHKGVAYMAKEYYYDSRALDENGHGANSRRTDEEHYAEIEKLAGDRNIERVIVDPSAASFIETIRRHRKFHVWGAENSVLDGIRLTATLLQAGRIKIHRSCKGFLSEVTQYRWDEDANEDKVIKENDHACDATRYFCSTVFGLEFYRSKPEKR